MKLCKFMSLLLTGYVSTVMAGGQPVSPTWPNSVKVFTTSMSNSAIAAVANGIFSTNGGLGDNGQFVNQGYAMLFAPGVYSGLTINVGYYTSVIGLGTSYSNTAVAPATYTFISNVNSPEGSNQYCVGALNSFWRSAENFSTGPTGSWSTTPSIGMTWAVSQAAPLRRIQVLGNLYLFEVIPGAGYASGFSSGGFMADCSVVGTDPLQSAVICGSQQQWCSRNVNVQSAGAKPGWSNGVWNQVFVGCTGAPASHCGNCNTGTPPCQGCSNCYTPTTPGCYQTCATPTTPCGCPTAQCDSAPGYMGCAGNPYTNVAATPKIAEKPYITSDVNGQNFALVIPNVETNKIGTSLANNTQSTTVSFSSVYVATTTDTAASINAQIANGNHVILTPGQYNLTDSIVVTSNTVVLGIGFPMLISTTGKPCIIVGGGNARVGGILLQAGPSTNPITPTLLKWSGNNGFLYDCFARTGRFQGVASEPSNPANMMVQINGSNVVCDNLWLWRADHDTQGIVCNELNPCQTGVEINGENVIAYGLASEHTLQDLAVWNGNNGQCYFFQAEFPYDAPVGYDYVGYRVGSSVTSHKAWGVGVYSFFRDHDGIMVNTAISAPLGSGIQFTNALTRFLNGFGGIASVLSVQGVKYGQNTDGTPAVSSKVVGPAYLCNYTGTTQTTRTNLVPRL